MQLHASNIPTYIDSKQMNTSMQSRIIDMTQFDNDEEKMILFAIQQSLRRVKKRRCCKYGITVNTKRIAISKISEVKECSICFDTPIIEHLSQLSCSHTYCSGCIVQHITTAKRNMSTANFPLCRHVIDVVFIPYTASMGTKEEIKTGENYTHVNDALCPFPR